MLNFESGNTRLGDISQEYISDILNNLVSKRQQLGFIDVEKYVQTDAINSYVETVGNNFESVVILGMGGSALGAKALVEAAHGKYYNEGVTGDQKKIYILDNIDTDTILDIEKCIGIEKTLFCFISKSGTTIEPLSQYLYFREQVKRVTENWKQHFCFVVGENCSMRQNLEKDFQVFFIPENTGGRFSVFTAVGLLPLAFTGVNISQYLEGIKNVRDNFISSDLTKNTALKYSLTLGEYYKTMDIGEAVVFSYSSRLFQFGEWYKQLLAESIGKNGKGFTPISSIGASDQHSELQLYQDGPKNKFFTFISFTDTKEQKKVHDDYKNLYFHDLLTTYMYGTQTSLKQEGHPVCNIELSDRDEYTIAELLYFYMFVIAFLGEILGVNAFDQPGVEKSKSIAKQKLKDDFGDMDLFHKAFYG